jgi:hypothetical protein
MKYTEGETALLAACYPLRYLAEDDASTLDVSKKRRETKPHPIPRQGKGINAGQRLNNAKPETSDSDALNKGHHPLTRWTMICSFTDELCNGCAVCRYLIHIDWSYGRHKEPPASSEAISSLCTCLHFKHANITGENYAV